MKLERLSFYKILIMIVVLSVLLVMGVKSYLSYKDTESRIIENLKVESEISLVSLQNNLGYLIESYAVNEYEKLIANEMVKKNVIGILVEDFNMGSLLNGAIYKTGSIRDSQWQLTNVGDNQQLAEKVFANCFHQDKAEIYSKQGVQIGTVAICNTDQFIQKELDSLVINSLLEALLLSIIMIALLVFTIRYFLLIPIANIVDNIRGSGKDGLPLKKLPIKGATEVVSLSSGINRMLDTIRCSRDELSSEKERFELAIRGTQDGLWDWHVPSGKVYHSKRFETMLGYSGNELPDTLEAWSSLLHPEDAEMAMKNVNKYFDSKGQSIYQSLFRMKTKNGQWLWISGRGQAIFDSEGNPIRFVGFNTDVTTEIEHKNALAHTAKHDVLTGLPNRFMFNEIIEKSMAYALRNNRLLTLLFIDLDGFKQINDHYGHDIGDCLLIALSQRFNKTIRAEDIVARLGGDEFVVALTDIDRKEDAGFFVERLLKELAHEVTCDDENIKDLKISASVGITFYPQARELGSEALLRQADQAMYQAKSAGKNRYHIYSLEEDNAIKIHLERVNDFRQALELNQFVLHYQPKVDLRTSKVIGVEALIRWQHPEKGLVYPDHFLPTMNQEAKLMLSLSRWVVIEAVTQLSAWKAQNIDLIMSINISSHDLNDGEFETFLNRTIAKFPNVTPDNIELEILESTALEDSLEARDLILAAQVEGMTVALDDFGTGYSSLRYLKDLPVDVIKIDKSFVIDMLSSQASLTIIKASMGLANAFDCDVVAEGVETIEHGELLLQFGCHYAQGYVIAKPMPANEIPNWVLNYQGFEAWKNTKKLLVTP